MLARQKSQHRVVTNAIAIIPNCSAVS